MGEMCRPEPTGYGHDEPVRPEKVREMTEEEAFAMATAIAEDTIRMFRDRGIGMTRTKSDLVAEMMEIIMPKERGN